MYEERAREFLQAQTHMIVAVVTEDGLPWAVPVNIQHRDGAEFEWDSMETAVHSQAIAAHPSVSLCLYQKAGNTSEEVVVYGAGRAEIIAKKDGGLARYRAVLSEAWINGADHIKRELSIADLDKDRA